MHEDFGLQNNSRDEMTHLVVNSERKDEDGERAEDVS